MFIYYCLLENNNQLKKEEFRVDLLCISSLASAKSCDIERYVIPVPNDLVGRKKRIKYINENLT